MFHCDLCSISFTALEHRREHVKRSIKHIKEMSCNVCRKVFLDQASLELHREMSHKHKDKLKNSPPTKPAPNPLRCTLCNLTCRTSSNLKTHLASKRHAKIAASPQPFYCSICGKAWATAVALNAHLLSRIHGPVSPLLHCGCCNKSFAVEEVLRMHEATPFHLKLKNAVSPAYCTVCGRAFFSVHGLRSHLGSGVHGGLEQVEGLVERMGEIKLGEKVGEEKMAEKTVVSIKCVGSRDAKPCKRSFRDASSMIAHLEGGLCVCGVDRKMIDAMFRRHDPLGIVDSSWKDLEDGGGEEGNGAEDKVEDGNEDDNEEDDDDDDKSTRDLLLTTHEIEADDDSSDSDDGGILILTPTTTLSRRSSAASQESLPPAPAPAPAPEEDDYICPLCPIASDTWVFESESELLAHTVSAHTTSATPEVSSDPAVRALKIYCYYTRRFGTLSALIMYLEHNTTAAGDEVIRRVVRFLRDEIADR